MSDGPFFGPCGRRSRDREPSAAYPTPLEIAGRAYELFLADGRRGDESEYWRRAEDELLERAARRAIR
jgi:hypothetical protein